MRARQTHIWSAHLNVQPNPRDQLSTRVATRVSDDQRGPWRGRYAAALLHGRWTRDLCASWDVGLQGGLWSDDRGTQKHMAGTEVGYRLAPGMWFSVGYNVAGLRDRELAGADYIDTGWYLRLRMKFDERTFATDRSSEATP